MDESASDLRRERDLYRRLLELGHRDEVDEFLQEALSLVAEIAGAPRGYLELQGEVETDQAPLFWTQTGFTTTELETVRRSVSRGIIAEALTSGDVIETTSAANDPRFEARGSIQDGRIQAVLCAPIGDELRVGVLYLEGPVGLQRWPSGAPQTVGFVARHLGPFAERLLVRERSQPDETRALRREMRIDGVVGRSPALAKVLEDAGKIASMRLNVLLTGDTGTGKSQMARVIHLNGPRADGPFVELNCATLPESLVESELFGFAKGAHNQADRPAIGKVEAAHGGTLFLDEVGEISLAIQAKLLHLVEHKRFFRLGSTKPVDANVRIIAATNANLDEAVAGGTFLDTLFFRLRGFPIRMPTLAQRRGDVPDLARHLLGQVVENNELPSLTFTPAGILALEMADWPGNVRELASVVQSGAIRAAMKGACEIGRGHLFPELSDPDSGEPDVETLQEATHRFRKDLVRRVLDDSAGVTDAARRLDVSRQYLHKLIRELGLKG